jgi:integrase/fructose-specific phosphotransferase system component IIB
MKSHDHISKSKDGVFYYRRRIPSQLVEQFKTKVIKKSLKTKDIKEARRIALAFDVEINKELAAFERKKNITVEQASTTNTSIESLKKNQTLDKIEIELLSNSYLKNNLETDEIFRDRLKSASRETSQAFIHNANNDLINNAIAYYENIESFYEFASVLARSNQIDFEALNEDSKNKLTKSYLIALKLSAKHQEKRDVGEWISTHDVVKDADTFEANALKMDKVFEDWKTAEPNRNKKTVATYQYIFNDFKRMVNDKNAKLITYQDANDYRTQMISQNLSVKTVRNKLKALKAIFARSKRNRLINENPFDIDLASTTTNFEKPRLSYSNEDLKVIFASDIYLANTRPKGGGGEASAWLPILAYATGARLEELCQLRVNNVKKSDNFYYLEITNTNEKGDLVGSVKNKSSIRDIPLHFCVIEAGFIRYVESIKTEYIFNDLTTDSFGKRGGNWSKWYGRYLRGNLKITNSKKTFHSFRHVFADLCKATGIPEAVQHRLMGHSQNEKSYEYGSGYSVEKLNEYIQTIKLPVSIPALSSLYAAYQYS